MRLVLSSLLLISSLVVQAQYDFYIKSFLGTVKTIPEKLVGEFEMKRDFTRNYFEFSNPDLQIFYYPPEDDCGHFNIWGKQYLLKGRYKESEYFGCDLDWQSMEVFHIKVRARTYLIISSIAMTNGKGTRDVFFQLFDVTNKKNVIYYPLWSIYGSHLSFGDYNNDGKLDFLETRYEATTKDDNTFRVVFKTINEHHVFETVKDKYIVFHQEYTDDLPKISVIEKHW